MPPKKAPRTPRAGKGKGKGAANKKARDEKKKAKAAAREKKRLKKLKKFSKVLYNDEFIWTKPRGELEVIAWTLQRQVEVERAERIAMRYERDWFFEMTQVYLQKIRNIRRKMEMQLCETNDDQLDAEEAKLFTRLSRKQALYGTMMKTSAIEMRYRKRFRKFKKILEIMIKNFQLDDKKLAELVAALPAARQEKQELKSQQLDNLPQHLNEIYDESEAYIEMLRKIVNAMIKDRKVIVHSELLQDVDGWSQAGHTELARHKREFTICRNLYIDQAHNSLSLIMLILNHWDDIDEDNKWRESHRQIFDIATKYLTQNYNTMLDIYVHAKAKAIQDSRAIQRLNTSYKTLRISENYLQRETTKLNEIQTEFDLMVEVRKWVDYEWEKIWVELVIHYAIVMYELYQLEKSYHDWCSLYNGLKERYIQAYGREAVACYWELREGFIAQRDSEYLAKLLQYRTFKLHDDMYNSVKSRVDTLGVHRRNIHIDISAEDVTGGEPVFMIGREHGLSSTPMTRALMRRGGFPLKKTREFLVRLPPCLDDEEEVYADRDMFDLMYYADRHGIKC